MVFENRYVVHNGIKQMSFGAWENRRICDIDSENVCHLLYLAQNSLVKESGINCHGIYQNGECFCEILLKAHKIFVELNQVYPRKKDLTLFTFYVWGSLLYSSRTWTKN